jgi:hypothetical protein
MRRTLPRCLRASSSPRRTRSSRTIEARVDDLVSVTCSAALEADALVVCNPFPGDALPLDVTAWAPATERSSTSWPDRSSSGA